MNQYQLILGGDFNIDMLANNNTTIEFNTLLNVHSCENVIMSPTRITTESETLLDLFITNFKTDSLKSGTIAYALSDHMPIFISVNLTPNSQRQPDQTSFYRVINDQTLCEFKERLSILNWEHVFEETDPDEAYEKFLEIFTDIYNASFRLKNSPNQRKVENHGSTKICCN